MTSSLIILASMAVLLISALSAQAQQLFVVGGDEGSAVGTTEVVSLDSQSSCSNLADFPAASHAALGVFIGGRAMVCGGRWGAPYTANCYTYIEGADEWMETEPMTDSRGFMAAVQMTEDEWWVTGGMSGGSFELHDLATTEVYNATDGRFSAFVDLPVSTYWHSMVKVNLNIVVLFGGDHGLADVWMFDMRTEQFVRLANLPFPTAATHAGLVTYPDGRREIAVAAGLDSAATQFLSLDTLSWRLGPYFPAGMLYAGSSVPYGDTFLIVGGEIEGLGAQRSIYMFNVVYEEWELLPQMLALPRSSAASFLVPDDFVACT